MDDTIKKIVRFDYIIWDKSNDIKIKIDPQNLYLFGMNMFFDDNSSESITFEKGVKVKIDGT